MGHTLKVAKQTELVYFFISPVSIFFTEKSCQKGFLSLETDVKDVKTLWASKISLVSRPHSKQILLVEKAKLAAHKIMKYKLAELGDFWPFFRIPFCLCGKIRILDTFPSLSGEEEE